MAAQRRGFWSEYLGLVWHYWWWVVIGGALSVVGIWQLAADHGAAAVWFVLGLIAVVVAQTLVARRLVKQRNAAEGALATENQIPKRGGTYINISDNRAYGATPGSTAFNIDLSGLTSDSPGLPPEEIDRALDEAHKRESSETEGESQ